MEDIIIDQTDEQGVIEWNYAGFFIRLLAYIIDSIILGIAQVIIIFSVTGFDAYLEPGFNSASGINFIIALLYFTMLESSSYQGTLGKRALGLKVCDPAQQQISFPNAVGRYFAKFLSGIILFIGFIMVGVDKYKQGLHDKLANTYVIYG